MNDNGEFLEDAVSSIDRDTLSTIITLDMHSRGLLPETQYIIIQDMDTTGKYLDLEFKIYKEYEN